MEMKPSTGFSSEEIKQLGRKAEAELVSEVSPAVGYSKSPRRMERPSEYSDQGSEFSPFISEETVKLMQPLTVSKRYALMRERAKTAWGVRTSDYKHAKAFYYKGELNRLVENLYFVSVLKPMVGENMYFIVQNKLYSIDRFAPIHEQLEKFKNLQSVVPEKMIHVMGPSYCTEQEVLDELFIMLMEDRGTFYDINLPSTEGKDPIPFLYEDWGPKALAGEGIKVKHREAGRSITVTWTALGKAHKDAKRTHPEVIKQFINNADEVVYVVLQHLYHSPV